MKIQYIILLCAILGFVSTSCDNNARVSVTNKVSNVRLENISYGDISLGSSKLIFGETTGERTISDRWDGIKFPMNEKVQFYMVSGDNRVLLITKESYKLDEDQHLNIVIDDDTDVINPATVNSQSMLKMKEIK
ncbi:hypothetical protein GGR21_002966 [Dysgonomonas hofstadii]|uniref:Lipoprotein n=1 Tax=Dysgonomonas hofstadii TaxID=637886 RepID=A0A840CX88_9BACT|nr:hypothetical protein [Dysgonomonas hofstadii]MBB4037052.1 hypothetical protein [Dysgonomonas hofstadii]